MTVCVLHFNRPELVKQAVSSVLAQTYEHLEILLFDDGSDARARSRSSKHWSRPMMAASVSSDRTTGILGRRTIRLRARLMGSMSTSSMTTTS